MSKRVFDCSISDPAPSAAGAETEDDDGAAPDEDDSSPRLLMSTNNDPRKHRRAMGRDRGEIERIKSHTGMEGVKLLVAFLSLQC